MRSLFARLSDAVLRAYRAARHLAEWLLYDRRQEFDTGRKVELEELGLDHPDREAYQPTRWSTMRSLMPKSSVHPGDVFVDYGSGMGRVVQLAAAYPFERVIGVEISEELNEIARRNFERNRRRFNCKRVEFVTRDAVSFEVPVDMTHAYFFNPFKGETFRAVLDNIIASIDRNPRRVVLIYHLPEEKQMVEDSGRFRLVDEKRTARTVTARIYESVPAASPSGGNGVPEGHQIRRRGSQRRVASARSARERIRATLMPVLGQEDFTIEPR
jgi:precorrin-6B methylase 2